MITEFNKYNLILEKSTLDVLFGNRDFTREFYKKFDIVQNFKYKKLDITQFKDVKEFEEFFRYYLTTFIVDTEFDILVFKRNIDMYTTVNDRVWFYNYNKKMKIFSGGNILTINDIYFSLTISYKDIIKDIFICDISMKDRSMRIPSYNNEDLIKEFDLYYKNIFVKLYKKYLNIINELIDKTDRINNKEYYFELLSDREYAYRLIENIFYFNSFRNTMGITNINEIAKRLYEANNIRFNFIKYKNWDKILSQNDLEFFKDMKNKIFNPELIKKYKHLYNSENFDLI